MLMKNVFLIIGFFVILSACKQKEQPEKVDVLIVGGSIFIDDSPKLMQLELGITQNKIVYLGKEYLGEAARVIDATGLVVSPGFIDMHTHLDPLMKISDAKSHLMQGSTTALGGPDGGGPWPFEPYLDSLDHMALGINVAYLVCTHRRHG